LYFAASLTAGWVIGRYVPIPLTLPDLAGRWIAAALLLMAAALAAIPTSMFLRARTTVFPHRPANKLVIQGPYRFTRNPMYVGMACLYSGVSILLEWWWALILLPGVLFLLQRNVIYREEAYLHRRFGAEYDHYREGVRRWI
jgi:protein-S-isoprenylcysteine O-methyltransferase Ste14